MATVPLSGSNIRVLSDVPFSNDYKNTRWFDTKTEQTNYFLSKATVYNNSEHTFQRADGQTFISVQKSIDSLWGANYVMFQNASYNNKWFYAFVTKLEYVNSNNTRIHFQIDVFQTWKFDMNFKPSYVVREHCTLWNSDGTPVLNTQDEGLDYGTEYDNVSVTNYQPTNGYKWLVIVSKTIMHGDKALKYSPTVIGVPQPLSVYILPFKDDDSPANIFLTKNNVGVITGKPTEVMNVLYKDDDAVNNVVSMYITDYTGIPYSFTASPDLFTFPDNGNLFDPAQIGTESESFNCLYVKKVKTFSSLETGLGAKYSNYKTVKESKLLMYPYTQLILDDFKGNRAVFKNEHIDANNLELITKGSLGTSNKTSYGIKEYNSQTGGYQDQVSDESALINQTPNDIPIITDMLAAYLQGNRNSLETQRNSILFNGVMNGIGGTIGAVASGMTGNVAGIASSAVGVAQGAGNTTLQLQAMQSKKDDISNTPPQIAKMGSNSSYTFGNKYDGVYIIKKQIKDEYIRKLEDFFNMYGYKVNRVKVPNFHTRTKWNYVQTLSCTILGSFNNEDLNELKAVFDNGITFWHTDDVGNYDLENGVI